MTHPRGRVGLNNVGSYQVSGHPYITGAYMTSSTTLQGQRQVDFPYITKQICIINTGSADLDFYFRSRDVGNVNSERHYITVPGGQTPPAAFTYNVKCKQVFISISDNVVQAPAGVTRGGATGFQLAASLTNIPTSSMYELTGSGVTA